MKFQRTKVEKISKPITPFAGIYYVNQEYNKLGYLVIENKHLLILYNLL
jgi:hypothetical protein